MRVAFRDAVAGTDFADLVTNTVFLRLFSGRVVTDVGDSAYYIAAMWLVWDLTGSAFYTGVAGALIRGAGALNFLAGPLVDRWQLRRVLLSTQLVNGIGVLLVPLAAATGTLSVWLVLFLMPVIQFVNGFVYPAQDAALPRVVDDEQLTRANSLFSTTLRTVDTVANAVAGVLIAVVGALVLFVVNAATFAIAAILFVGVTVPETKSRDDASEPSDDDTDHDTDDEADVVQGYLADLREGIGYVRGSLILTMVFGFMLSNVGTAAATVVLPAFADSLSGPTAYGLLLAAMGAGSLVGSGSAFLVEDYPLGWVSFVGNLLSGLLWLAAVAVPGVWATTALLFAAMVPRGVFQVLFGSILQSAVDDELIGRVTSLVRTLSQVVMPVSAFLGGVAANAVGSVTVMYGAGGAIALFGLYYLAHPGLRSIPKVAEADAMALELRSPAESPDTVESG